MVPADHHQAFDLLFRHYYNQICNFTRRYMRNDEMARDITQSVFLQLYLSFPMLHVDRSLKGWLYQVTRHRCLDQLRRKHAIPFSQLEDIDDGEGHSPLDFLQDPDPLPEARAEGQENQSLIRKAIEELPPKYRMIVLLRYDKQLSFGAIGNNLHIPENTTKTYFYRAKPILQAALASLNAELA